MPRRSKTGALGTKKSVSACLNLLHLRRISQEGGAAQRMEEVVNLLNQGPGSKVNETVSPSQVAVWYLGLPAPHEAWHCLGGTVRLCD